jgi:hypothetical protein
VLDFINPRDSAPSSGLIPVDNARTAPSVHTSHIIPRRPADFTSAYADE